MIYSVAPRWMFLTYALVLLISFSGCKKKADELVVTPDPPKDKTFLPRLDIATTGNVQINSTDTYVTATISIDGLGVFDNYKGSAQIRGRGNSTWNFPKKPYKFKLDQNAGLLGMAAEKDWVLLANYLDGTHMLNAVAMKTGQLLSMPFTNHIEPVEVYLNGQYQGLYMLTEQIEVKKNRVNVGDNGVLVQLEQYYDEEWKFRSAGYRLPVMVMHPELTNAEELVPIKAQFEQMEATVARSDFPNNNFLDFIDAESVANYFLVNMLTDNRELNHPKSTFLHKTKTGKWTMGPIWDFDWAYSYEKTQRHFSNFDQPMLWSPPSDGTRFFSRLMAAPAVKAAMKQKWADFKTQKLPELLAYVDNYAVIIEDARARDYQKWKRGNLDFKNDVVTLKLWLQNRAGYMDGFIKGL
ncbi:CotH kinase family protein [Haliscomenobacter hydrossis]|uniref:Spore coat protein CotH n=1 Tax=Haliscomenobacter hydrossis (strain ATCC 27775 / DSM 1100 / LMG 10767 / O) TaxID=760192 RepID=F4KWX3_HALH1|nr:CotH kinase family protein [Haliscomenobacter hydrossis]AEE53573.1 Spore coat protein CotH [Haliscomenobacter hydrossis DSM 1100]